MVRGLAALLAFPALATAAEHPGGPPPPPTDQAWAIHGQATFVDQVHTAFTSPYRGANSLAPYASGRETFDATLFAGLRPWRGAELWVNPEIDQGFGLSNTLGVAGFPSGEAYKVGKAKPYFRLQRLFLRQTINLSGASDRVEPDLNQLAGHQSDNRLVITLGKFGVTDMFDTSRYAHDPKHDFLNWGVIDAGTFDYAADAWGYSAGAAIEWYQGAWTLRAGAFDLSDVPNSEKLDPKFGQFQLIGELERRFTVAGQPGSAKLTGFVTRGRMGQYDQAVALGLATGSPANTALVRRYGERGGVNATLSQQVARVLGVFLRAGVAGGAVEPYEFADIDATVSGGLSLSGARWGRSGDTLALAGEINGISKAHQAYLAAGGVGILVGDGRLPHYGREAILETYYDIAVGRSLHLAVDYQFVNNPAYNRDRGPVSIFAARIHTQF